MNNTKEQMLLDNQGLVYSVIDSILSREQQETRMSVVGLSREDLIQEGMIGLWMACKNFDESKGNKFSTYAYLQIKGYALNCLNKKAFDLKYPGEMTLEEKLELENSKVSLNTMVADSNGSKSEYINSLDESEVNFVESAKTDLDTTIQLNTAVDTLPKREKNVIRRYFFNEKTMKEIGQEEGITHQAVSLYKNAALKKLKKSPSLSFA